MAPSRHKAIVAGLALTLTLGTAAAPAVATMSNESPTTDTDPNGVGAPLPSDYDKADFYQGGEGGTSFAMLRTGSRLAPLGLSDEMKYFAKFESSCNYDQGFSYGDGYNALGYYQFDRRYGLMDFIQQVYNSNPAKYAMFEGPLSNRSLLSDKNWSAYNYDSKQLKREAQELNDAWHAAYKADPTEFSALQDSYAYNTYYLPVQSILLNKFGVDVRNRADCVKGLVWGMCNLFGQGGVQNYLRDANLSNSMADRELVTALCDTVVERVTYYCSSQPQYWKGWQNRYRNEKKICLEYIAEDEAQAEASKPQPAPPTVERPQVPSSPGVGGPSAGEPGAGDPLPSDPQPGDAPSADAGSGAPQADDEGGAGAQSDDSASFGSMNQGDSSGGTSGSTGGASDATSPQAPQGGDSNSGASNTPAGGGSTTSDTEGGEQGAGSSNDGASADDGASTGDGSSASNQGSESQKEESEDKDNSIKTSVQDDASKKQTTSGDLKSGSDDVDDPDNTAGKNVMNKDADSKPKDGLPQTGDIGMLVMTGAAGLATAGASFVSLGKLESKEREGEDESAE